MKLLNISRLTIVALFLFLSACQKRGTFEVPCKIETVYSNTNGDENTATFTYNAWGDPVTIIQSNPTTGRPHYYFTYDSNHRLKTWKSDYGTPDFVEYYAKYYYDNNNFIVRDTTWFQGSDINDLSTFGSRIVSEYAYDSKGRVSKVKTRWVDFPAAPVEERVYTYDANDNLIRSGGTYDNKTNYLRTSLVLAFMMRDYSKNNVYAATSYNSKNLPTAFATGGKPPFFNTPISGITYTCDSH
jgi:hypothetical protein